MMRFGKRCLPILPVALTILSVLPIRASAESLYQAYAHGMALGNGHDSYSASNKLSCVTYQVVPSNTPGAVQATNWYWDLVESNQDLFEKTSVSASASVNTVSANASAEMSMLQQNQLSMYNVNVLSLVDVDLRWDYATQVQLKPEYQQLMVSDPEQFLEKCGNYYVSGIRVGGSFYNLITISTSSQTDKNAVSAKVSGGYGPFSASASAGNETVDTLSSRKATIKGYSTGSGGGAIPLDPASMTTRVQGFEQEIVKSGGTMTGVLLDAYPKSSAGFDPKIWKMASARWDYISLRREIEFAESSPGQFYMERNSWKPRLTQLRKEADDAIAKFDQAIQACRTSPDACTEPAGIQDAEVIRQYLPPRYSGMCGRQDLDIGTSNKTEVFPLSQRCGGDTEMNGNNPSITLEAKLNPVNNGKQIDMFTKITMKEDRRDWTCFWDSQSKTLIYDLDKVHPGCYLTDPLPTGNISAHGGKDNHKLTTYTGTGIVEKAECLSDTKGHDDGKLGCRNITFLGKIPVTLAHDEDRQGQNVYSPEPKQMAAGVPPVALKASKTMNPFAIRMRNISNMTRKTVVMPSMKLDAEPLKLH